MRIPLPLESAQPQSTARLINCHVEQAPQEGRGPVQLTCVPGITALVTPGLGVGRGVYTYQGNLYAVCGSTLLQIAPNGTQTVIGTVPGNDVVQFANNDLDLAILTGTQGYYVRAGVLQAMSLAAGYVPLSSITSIDGYIVGTRPSSNVFSCSALQDASSWPGLYYSAAGGTSDYCAGIVRVQRELWIAKTATSELWYDAGTNGFPFTRSPSGFVDLGCVNGRTLVNVDNSAFWLASDLTVRRNNGTIPVRVSTYAIEKAIAGYSRDTISSAYAFTYTQRGHIFYVLQFPGTATFAYDTTTQKWHEKASYGYPDWRICSATYAYGKVFVQNVDTGAVGYLDETVATEFGAIQRGSVTFGALYNDANRLFITDLEILYRATQAQTGQGANFGLSLEFANDLTGRFKFLSTKQAGGIGTAGRLRWSRLGQARTRVFRLSWSDPVPFTIDDASVEMSVGPT